MALPAVTVPGWVVKAPVPLVAFVSAEMALPPVAAVTVTVASTVCDRSSVSEIVARKSVAVATDLCFAPT